MSHEHEQTQDTQISGTEWKPDPRHVRFMEVINSWSNPVAYEAIAALSSILLAEDIEERIKEHSEQGDWERRIVIYQFRKADMNNKQIRFVFRHYGLKIPKDGLKNKRSS